MAKTLGICGFIHLASGVNICHYRDRIGLEFGVVLALKEGRYALIEAKLSDYQAKEASGICGKPKNKPRNITTRYLAPIRKWLCLQP